ncbi:cyanophycin synthetase [Sideroxyarcus emersonii]|uniref:Cyanophycin synthetase n=1 Tax=Sideroxyarcus emersonii TaxID=2764705 RepID=A0AAN1X929_9PROT|nr:cyanophycin synthetase [Sideroxyarcus emersonii]BCK86837.1 cyanophycin synthetase [Sideroxyarcus emersonii]
MEFLKILPLRGPNIWTYRPVLEVWLDIGDLEDSPSNTIPGYYERLSAWLPSLIEHRCSIGERGGFLQRLREGTWPGHILEHVTIELQNLAGMQSGFGKARGTSVRGIYKVVVRSRNEQVTHAALHAARDLILAAMQDKPFDVAGAVAQLHEMVDSLCLGPSTACIVEAATDRGIPSIRLNDGNLVQFGHGVHQRRIWTAETDQTSAIAEGISRDKDLSKSLLSACGVPVPEGRIVDSPADAWEAAEEIGVPVVVKPSDANHGRGVSAELTTREEIEAAFHLADAEGSEVMVERFIRGNEHRLLVVGGRLAAAARGESVSLVADGHSTIRQLIDTQINTDPRRGPSEEFPLDLIMLDEDAAIRFELERQGYTADSVPPQGKRVLVQRNGNVSIDVTDAVHPEVAATVALAARVIGLDIAGVDLVAEDISRPLAEQGGAVVEINAGPGLLMHLKPAEGQPRPVGKAIIDNLFAEGRNGRIPVVGISGTNGKSLTARMLARLLHLRGSHAGLACADGLYFAQRLIDQHDAANWASAQKVLLNRSVEVAVIENGSDTILTEGLGYDRCQIGIVTNIDAARHFGKYYIETPEQVCNVFRTQVDVVLPEGVAVLNAADPLVAPLAEYCDGEVIFFSRTGETELIASHLRQGGRAVLVKAGHIVCIAGMDESEAIGLAQVPVLANMPDPQQLDSVLATVAAAWALAVPVELIRGGLATYTP